MTKQDREGWRNEGIHESFQSEYRKIFLHPLPFYLRIMKSIVVRFALFTAYTIEVLGNGIFTRYANNAAGRIQFSGLNMLSSNILSTTLQSEIPPEDSLHSSRLRRNNEILFKKQILWLTNAASRMKPRNAECFGNVQKNDIIKGEAVLY